MNVNNAIYSVYFFIRKKICKRLLNNENVSIICNNCLGADILHKYGIRFNSPTVNLQILACDFTEFCENLHHYRDAAIVPVTGSSMVTEIQNKCFSETFGGRSIDEMVSEMPIGLLDGKILIVFQHYKSYEEAVKKWRERFERIQDRCKFLFVVYENQVEFCEEFVHSGKINDKTIVFINFAYNFSNQKLTNCYQVYAKGHFMDKANLLMKNYEKYFNTYRWIRR